MSNPGSQTGSVSASASRVLRNRWFLAILFSALVGSCGLSAQEVNALVQTNGISQSEDLTGNDAAQPADSARDDEAASTNTVAETNQSANPGPDARTRRILRKRRAPSFGNSQANGSGSAGTNLVSALDYAAFRLVTDRNIFDPNRSPRSTATSARPKTVESFTLVGTMSYEKGVFAFFDGTSSDYKKAVKREESIAGYKVMTITPESVKLMRNTNLLEMSVGTQMRRRDDGTWERSEGASSYADTSSAAAQPAASASGAESDIIKKMMQRREKE